ncbi:glycosyltransferase family 2 protein [Comamonas aquatica]|uniref:glycosyltransferase family 2 protein n=1 Tax=Comamonas aquatica TaxID=225991 RepID=UPI0021B0E7A6|nr:glycosyltransferase [Comamonas aquatica]
MPAFNSEKYIKNSIESVLNQTYKNIELIVIDDGSSDKTIDIIEKFQLLDKRLILIKNNSNLGVAKSRNIGVKNSKGRFIAFLDSDDLWDSKKLEIQIKLMLTNNWSFTYTLYRMIDHKGNIIKNIKAPKKLNYADLLKTCYIGCLTAVYDTEVFGRFLMPTSNQREDYLTWLQLLKIIPHAFRVSNIPLASYRIHPHQSSRKKLSMAMENWKIYKNIENLGTARAIYYFLCYATNGLIRKYF